MKLTEYDVRQFMEIVASGNPTPGGGSVAALLGAVGAALGAMVARLTIGRDKYQDQEALAQELLKKSQQLMEVALQLVERDAAAFNKVAAARKLPKTTSDEQTQRLAEIQNALKFATEVPFETMENSVGVLQVLEKAVHNTNLSATSDLGVAACSALAALQGGWLNVLVNLKNVKDEDYVERYRRDGRKILEDGTRLAARVQQEVEKLL